MFHGLGSFSHGVTLGVDNGLLAHSDYDIEEVIRLTRVSELYSNVFNIL